jgi:hypothetical protein
MNNNISPTLGGRGCIAALCYKSALIIILQNDHIVWTYTRVWTRLIQEN